jgi:membrane fusion protein, adhesin transport system
MSNSWNDRKYMSEAAAAHNLGVHPFAHLLLLIIGLFFVVFIVWADWAVMDEVTVGTGKVIPSGQIRLVQNLEGGMLSALLVKEGDLVEKNQVLMEVDDTQLRASFRESRIQYLALKAKESRLQVEASGAEILSFPQQVLDEQPELARNETALWHSNQQEQRAGIETILKQIGQRKQELIELNAAQKQVKRRLNLAKKEYNLTAPMVKQGIMSRVELLRLKRGVAELEGELESTQLAIPRTQLTMEEAKNRLAYSNTSFRNTAQAELNEIHSALQQLAESMAALKDKVTRTDIRAPVKGTVIRVRVHTIGQVIRSGMDLVEIMPLNDSLLVEARIRPAVLVGKRLSEYQLFQSMGHSSGERKS